jgi:hypothetical protein
LKEKVWTYNFMKCSTYCLPFGTPVA